jgi:hypothetical protein
VFACVDFDGQPQSFEYLEPSNDESAVAFYKSTGPILCRMIESNPSYKEEVGSAIFDFVKKIAGEKVAPKITGMLIENHSSNLRRFMVDYDSFLQYITVA